MMQNFQVDGIVMIKYLQNNADICCYRVPGKAFQAII